MAKERDLDVKAHARWVGGAVAGLLVLLGMTWLGATFAASRSAGRAEDVVTSSRRDLGQRLEGAASVRGWRARRDATPVTGPAQLVAARSTSAERGLASQRALQAALEATAFRPARFSPQGDRIENDASSESREREHAEAWSRNQRTLAQAAIGEPPEFVRRVLARHRVDLALLSEVIASPSAHSLWDFGSQPISRIHEALLMDALVHQHDGDSVAASARVDDALRFASALTEQSSLTMRWWPSQAMVATFVTMRKVEGANEGWHAALAPDRLRQDLAASCLEHAEDLLAASRSGDAAVVLSAWRRQPGMARRLFLPLYRRRLAHSSALLANESRALLERLQPVTEDERSAFQTAHLAPLLPAPQVVREFMMGADLADLTEPNQGMEAHETGRAREKLEHLLWSAEITRRVLRLREERDAHPDGWWPADGATGRSEDLPGVHFVRLDAQPGHVVVAATSDKSGGFYPGPEPKLVFEAAPLR